MLHPFTALSDEYAHRFATMTVTRAAEAAAVARGLLAHRAHYDAVHASSGVPQIEVASLHERESGADFATYLGNGDPLSRPTVDVPRGRGPFATWAEGAADALHLDGLDAVTDWSIPRCLFEAELFNGFGYRSRGLPSPYLWAGTDQYISGKYVRDGQFDPNAVDEQLGVAAVMKALLGLAPDWGQVLGNVAPPANSPIVMPVPTPVGVHDAAWIQATLNKLGADPQLVVDDSYGRRTRAAVIAFQTTHGLQADGFAGPQTVLLLQADLLKLAA